MTKQESFKRRVRARMEQTGERYGAARRVLLEQADGRRRTWVAEPEATDAVIRANTGKGWEEWCDLIDVGPGREAGHPAIVAWVHEQHGVPGWWAQSVTVGYERITGLRLRHQMADGTFAASKSRTMTVDVDALRALLLDDADRAELFPGITTELRSKPGTKALRFAVDPGIFLVALDPVPDGRTRVTVSHEKLPTAADVDRWKAYWSDWLDAVADG